MKISPAALTAVSLLVACSAPAPEEPKPGPPTHAVAAVAEREPEVTSPARAKPAAAAATKPEADVTSPTRADPAATATSDAEPDVTSPIRADPAVTAAPIPEPQLAVRAPLEELEALGEAVADQSGPLGGGSIRAKRDADIVRAAPLRHEGNLEARVEAVSRGAFPLVALRLRVTKRAKTGPSAALPKGARIVVTPRLVTEAGHLDLRDLGIEFNAGAYYLRRGDKVSVRLLGQRGAVWQADYVERK